ncbi:FPR1, partial [Symbiodinium sp. KB8]
DSVEVTTLREGDGKTFPKEGDTIVLHYAGKLATADEKEPSFDSTYSRGKPFSC